jgi:hypothetical protein
MRLALLFCLASCWRATSAQPHAASRTLRRDGALAIDAGAPGRLVIDRDGVAWLAQCDGAQLRVRPWQGGEPRNAGPCAHRDTGNADSDDYFIALSPIAISNDMVATYLDTTHELVVTSPAGERRYSIGESVRDLTLAIDGAAVVLVARYVTPSPTATVNGTSLGNALAALVRLEGDRVDVHMLVQYGSTGPEAAPRFVAAGKQRMLLVSATGAAQSCDYRGACEPVRPGRALALAGAVSLRDGGIVLLDFDHSVSRIAADGKTVWTKKLAAFALIGATDDQVWVKTRPDDPLKSGLPIVALSLDDGTVVATPAIARSQDRDTYGRYLEIWGIATTPIGTVIRGEFAGTLSAGRHRLETAVRGALCWWSNPHDGDEYEVPVDEQCHERYRKAILTEHAAFVAINPPALRQRDD